MGSKKKYIHKYGGSHLAALQIMLEKYQQKTNGLVGVPIAVSNTVYWSQKRERKS
jgi:hypothetical protein